jgi:NCAIR mutase (PurE)-related protein
VSTPIRELLERFRDGEIGLDEALQRIRQLNVERVGEVAKIDICREDRIGVPEAVLAEGKAVEDLVSIAQAHLQASGRVIITRVSQEQHDALLHATPDRAEMIWNDKARIAVLRRSVCQRSGGRVGILSAGTADIPVAEEARIVAEEMGCEVLKEYDVGVAGIHRLFPSLERLMGVDAMVVAAGREGTLPAVVAGLVDAPVIGLPVSTGYGYGGNGRAALMSMLQSCSVISVVNIDAGFVAGAFAARIANKAHCNDPKS